MIKRGLPPQNKQNSPHYLFLHTYIFTRLPYLYVYQLSKLKFPHCFLSSGDLQPVSLEL